MPPAIIANRSDRITLTVAFLFLIILLGIYIGSLPFINDDRVIRYNDSFEQGIQQWQAGNDLPDDPDTGDPVGWNIRTSGEHAHTGTTSLRFFLDGRQDDGTVWIVRPVNITDNRAYLVNMSVHAWSDTESFNTLAHLVMYAGEAIPQQEDDFPDPGTTATGKENWSTGGLREPLNLQEGWREYRYQWLTPRLQQDQLYIAVGISAVWETGLTYYIDSIELQAVPR